MKVLLTLYGDETAFVNATPEYIAREMADWQAFDEAAREAGVVIACDGLEGSHTATTVRMRDGRRHVTDGPFIETKEAMAGIFVLEARDLDHALALAALTPIVDGGVEVRPLTGFGVM
jgi:hypothetical protein